MGSAIRKEWEGLTVDGKFALLEWLGGTEDHGVFLTIRLGSMKAALKLIRAEGEEADAYLAQWEATKNFPHTHLMPVYEFGRCVLQGANLVYVLTEHADRVLSQFIQQRALAPDEARDILSPILNALSHLHSNGCVHGHLKPSNILIVEDELKLATDDLLVAGSVRKSVRSLGSYDAPELATGIITPAADVWSLGMTVTEALTQRLPEWDPVTNADPALPRFMPQPFPALVQECLRVDPTQRRSLEEITIQLATLSARKPAAPERSPEPSPAPPTPPIARDLFPDPPPARPAAEPRIAAREPAAFAWQEAPPAPQTFGRSRYSEPYRDPGPTPAIFSHINDEPPKSRSGIWAVLGTALVFAIAGVALVKTGVVTVKWPLVAQSASAPAQSAHASASSTTPADATNSSQAASSTASTSPQPAPEQAPSAAPAAPSDATQSSDHSTATQTKSPAAPQPAPKTEPAAAQSNDSANAAPARSDNAPGDIAKRVMPSISPAASQSMHGPVLVEIRVRVSESGSVESATFMTSGPGNYFGKISQRAAEAWKFDPPMRRGRAEPSVWLLRFSYARGNRVDVSATPEGAE